ncbi:MAG TPA: diguanylate cyclase [Thermoguttaceae bacterium]|nr:diguanylate cyclase [Thermoguttaceae bacterium]
MTIILTLLVGVLNLCLGYVLAVRLGYGPPGLVDAWEVLLANRPIQPAAVQEPPPDERSADAPPQENVGPTLEEMLDKPYDEAYDDAYHEAYDEAYDAERQPGSEEPQLDAPEEWELDERFVEVSVLKLNIAMIRSGARTTDIDTRLRAAQGESDTETIQRCRDELLEDSQAFLAEHGQAADRFRERIEELGELRTLGDRIEMANLEQAAQVETTINNLQFMDFESDLEAANERLLEELKNLRIARHKLRDDQERAFLAIARYENRLAEMEKRMFNDALTRLPNRIGLEATLWQWWQGGRHRSRQTSAALFDLDAFGQANERYGALACDKILYQIAQVIQSQAGEADLVGRFSGQQFLLVILDVGPRKAIKSAELIRQSIERITFLSGDDEIRVTVGAGITEVVSDDTHEALFTRLEQALREAKEAGPNRSFLHDGQNVELVESPGLGAEYAEIPI